MRGRECHGRATPSTTSSGARATRTEPKNCPELEQIHFDNPSTDSAPRNLLAERAVNATQRVPLEFAQFLGEMKWDWIRRPKPTSNY